MIRPCLFFSDSLDRLLQSVTIRVWLGDINYFKRACFEAFGLESRNFITSVTIYQVFIQRNVTKLCYAYIDRSFPNSFKQIKELNFLNFFYWKNINLKSEQCFFYNRVFFFSFIIITTKMLGMVTCPPATRSHYYQALRDGSHPCFNC